MGRGLIHNSWSCWTNAEPARRYVLQRLNLEVFPDPARVMQNIVRVTEHLRRRLGEAEAARGTLRVVPARDGGSLVVLEDGSCWRCYDFVPGTRSYETISSPALAREAGFAFGRFQRLLVDLSGEALHETIPGFHDTPGRRDRFEAAVRADPRGRLEACRQWVEILRERSGLADVLEQGGALRRVTHNDTKLNNVLFDVRSGRAVCVVDLDTVMPGLVSYDFGDLVRSSVTGRADDRPSLEPVSIDLELLGALAEGYLTEIAPMLSPVELSQLPLAPEVLTYELALRFLSDHLEGDVYFRVLHPGDNLTRARSQIELLLALERQRSQIAARICDSHPRG